MKDKKKVKKMEVCPPDQFHRRLILSSTNGKCDCHTENPYSERDIEINKIEGYTVYEV
jgi:hypothetical protein